MRTSYRNLALILIPMISWFDGLSAFASEGRIRLDANTEYEIENLGQGFALKIFLSRYQFRPDMDVIAGNCKSAATVIAKQEASARKITGRLEISSQVETGRNILLGTSSCVATATFQAAPATFPKSAVLDAAIKQLSLCDRAAATFYSVTNENAHTIAEAVCSRCSKEWDDARKIATQSASKFHAPEDGPLLSRELCVSQNTNTVIELRAKRALTPAAPNASPRPVHKDRTI
jgi:hypothetical protein